MISILSRMSQNLRVLRGPWEPLSSRIPLTSPLSASPVRKVFSSVALIPLCGVRAALCLTTCPHQSREKLQVPLLGFHNWRKGLLKPLLCPQGNVHSEQEGARQAQTREEASPNQTFSRSKLGVVFRLHLPGGKYREAGPASGGLLLPAWAGPGLEEEPSAEGTAQARTGPAGRPPSVVFMPRLPGALGSWER